MFGLKDKDLMFVLFVVFGFFLAKMLSSKKEGYSPLDCSEANSESCCLGNRKKFSAFCAWDGNKCTWAYPREDFPECQTKEGRVGRDCDPFDPDKICCNGEYCDNWTMKCIATDSTKILIERATEDRTSGFHPELSQCPEWIEPPST